MARPEDFSEYQRCDDCGKVGPHSHGRAGRKMTDHEARKFLMTDYFSEAEPRILVKTIFMSTHGRLPTEDELTALLDDLRDKVQSAFPGLDFRALYMVHDSLVLATDPEHEPDNPNCLCFQPECATRARIRLPRRAVTDGSQMTVPHHADEVRVDVAREPSLL